MRRLLCVGGATCLAAAGGRPPCGRLDSPPPAEGSPPPLATRSRSTRSHFISPTSIFQLCGVTRQVSETVKEWEVLNDNQALWLRSPGNITTEEYAKFYKALAKVGRCAAAAAPLAKHCP